VVENKDPATYTLAYDEASYAVKRQEAALDDLRARTGILLAAAALVASFLGGAALANRTMALPGALAIGSFAVVGVLALLVLWPWGGWVFSFDPRILMAGYIEADPPATLPEMHRDLALHHADHVNQNQEKLDRLYWVYRGATVALVLQVILWLMQFAMAPSGKPGP
jgi:hypothetical protein